MASQGANEGGGRRGKRSDDATFALAEVAAKVSPDVNFFFQNLFFSFFFRLNSQLVNSTAHFMAKEF